MQVIMVKTGELKQVPDGYARNYLFPHHLAKPATASGVEQAQATQAKQTAELQARAAEYAALSSQLNTTTLTLKAPANEHGKLFAAVHADQLVQAFKDANLSVTGDMITLPVIKTIGEHTINVKIPGQTSAKVVLNIIAA